MATLYASSQLSNEHLRCGGFLKGVCTHFSMEECEETAYVMEALEGEREEL
jgi:hypothetical protein